jgi:hypothetical protein
MGANEESHRLVDMIPEAERPLASRSLHFLVESSDDRPLSDEDWAAVRQGEAVRAGRRMAVCRERQLLNLNA